MAQSISRWAKIMGLWMSLVCVLGAEAEDRAISIEKTPIAVVRGLTGTVSDVRIAVEAPQTIAPASDAGPHEDIDLKRMADWAINYLIHTPRKEFDYEPVYQYHPLRCLPVPQLHDVVRRRGGGQCTSKSMADGCGSCGTPPQQLESWAWPRTSARKALCPTAPAVS